NEERESKKIEKQERHRILDKNLEDRFIKLKCVEIENLVKYEILLEVIKDLEGLDSVEKLQLKDDISEKIKVNTNYYQKIRIGDFIDNELLEKNSTTRKGKNKDTGKLEEGNYKYSDDSGTIKDKKSFCFSAIKYTKSYDDLSQEAKDLCKKMYSFIENHNK
ncbi:MAG: hypothetical protein ACK4IX_15850, partial [Candidatus Sericytochromatia bacterium]